MGVSLSRSSDFLEGFSVVFVDSFSTVFSSAAWRGLGSSVSPRASTAYPSVHFTTYFLQGRSVTGPHTVFPACTSGASNLLNNVCSRTTDRMSFGRSSASS